MVFLKIVFFLSFLITHNCFSAASASQVLPDDASIVERAREKIGAIVGAHGYRQHYFFRCICGYNLVEAGIEPHLMSEIGILYTCSFCSKAKSPYQVSTFGTIKGHFACHPDLELSELEVKIKRGQLKEPHIHSAVLELKHESVEGFFNCTCGKVTRGEGYLQRHIRSK